MPTDPARRSERERDRHCGRAIILGWKTRSAAVAVRIATARATIVFRRFRDAAPAEAMTRQPMFMRNVSTMGGLIVLYAFGPGRYAPDVAENSSVGRACWWKPDTHAVARARRDE
jgi:hypothetical protein